MTRPVLLVATVLAVAACRTPTLYAWGSYEDTLYTHYRKPAEREAFVTSLRQVVLDADEQGLRVPPGCYAEYGYVLYEEGQFAQAATYFRKERDAWAESRALMDKMIANAERQGGRTSPAPPPPSAPVIPAVERSQP